MPATFVLLLKINAALLLFCAGYYLVLRKLTFYTLNRAYLVTAILFASIYPWIDLSAFVQRHEELARPIEQIAINWHAPAQLIQQPEQAIDYWYWLGVVFWIGAGVLLVRLGMQLFSLLRLYKTSRPRYINGYLVRIMDKDAAPFSFWQSIYINPQKHEPAELEAILQHEQIHVNQWHTADILLAELSSIFYWFNPGIWLIKKAVRENIEFITDRKILKNGIDSKTYQYSLVNVSFNKAQPGIVNHFNISTIKKRIIMMNAKRSSKLNLTRYAFVVPAVMALLLVFSISKADFAKPVRISLAAAVQPLARIININPDEVGDPAPKIAKAPKVSKKAKTVKSVVALAPVIAPQISLSPLTAIALTPQPAKNDTNKKLKLIVRDFKKDSLVFVVNGKVSTGKNLDPTNIENMYMLTGSQARKFAKVDDDKPVKVAYVITKDASNKEELEKAVARDIVIRKVVTANVSGDAVVRDDDDNDVAVIAPDDNFHVKPAKVFVVKSVTSTSTGTGSSNGTITVKATKGKPATSAQAWTIVSDGDAASSNGDVFVTGRGKKSDTKVIKVNGLSITTDNGKEPLFVIDGKTSTVDAMKKLDTDKIESISILKGDDATKKYGDKAKDGVVVIDTRKK
ncbi:M56 family metallopeptidase [Mucilaginibacter celer]|uniref:M56 family peptidase n=1 Tax=Mucilaginibacter celer TaxID=2305508 RepID=A0A494VJ74_9SPHI|nr:M56 family metallopeptidase [Mucilaginibacter celer]AYL95036.1 M56 family peptidase [Mucilaginibacter celer]